MIIDASGLIVGRFATVAAKKALLGEKVDIVNCENAVMSGSSSMVVGVHSHKRGRGTPMKGPFVSRMPDRFVRRIIRGMLPYKKDKGRDAYDRIMCHIGVPKELEGKKFETLDVANAAKRSVTRFITVKDLCKEMGSRIQ